MKAGLHPEYHQKAVIKCACGAEIVTGSTVAKMQTEICSACHPFYTGKKKFIDTTGRVDRFKRLSERAKAAKTEDEARKQAKAKKTEPKTPAKKTAAKKASPAEK